LTLGSTLGQHELEAILEESLLPRGLAAALPVNEFEFGYPPIRYRVKIAARIPCAKRFVL
jgi:hypothetical protein